MTITQLHRELGRLIQAGEGRRPVCISKNTFCHPLESDGVTILDVEAAAMQRFEVSDDDGGSALLADGSAKMRRALVLTGGSDPDEANDWRAPIEELKGSKPLVLYFASEADRAEFIEVVKAAKPGMRTVPL